MDPSEIRRFFTAILMAPGADRKMYELSDSGELKKLLPEIDAMRGVSQPPEFHPEGDVFEHTMVMLRHMVYPDPLLGWSVLLHDVGKPLTRTVESSGRIRFFSHEKIGAEMAEQMLENLGFDQNSRSAIVHAVRNHMRFANVEDMRKSKVTGILREQTFPLELELHRLDCISCHGKMGVFNFLLEEFLRLPEDEPVPLIDGKVLTALGMTPGKELGRLIAEIKKLQLAGVINDPEQARQYAEDLLQKKRADLKDM